MPLIRCKDDGMVPAVLICIHLRDRLVPWAQAVEVQMTGEEVSDWLCAACYKKIPTLPAKAAEALLATVCMNCCLRRREEAK